MPQSKLKLAFQTVLEGSKASARKRKRFRKAGSIVLARLQVLGTGACTESPVVALSVSRGADAKSLYLFNLNFKGRLVPGTSALTGSLRSVFFTGLSWEKQIAGAHAILQQNTVTTFNIREKFHLHGPSGIKEFMSTGCSFVFSPKKLDRFNSLVEYCEDESVPYVDENVTVKKVFLNANEPVMNTVSYFCHVNGGYARTVDMDKLVADHGPLDSAPGRERAIRNFMWDIKHGTETVHHPLTGQMIDRSEYTVQRNSPFFIILDCPTPSHFDILRESESFRCHFDGGSETPCVIAHITPNDIFSSQAYRDWSQNFGTNCHHIAINETNKDYYSVDACAHQHSMNQICGQLFPLVNDRLIPGSCKSDPGSVVDAHTGLCFDVTLEKERWSGLEIEEFNSALSQAKEDVAAATGEIESLRNTINITQKYQTGYFPRFVVLGCGASSPQKYRTQPGFLLRINAGSSIVIDCGGATTSKIYQHFGEEAEEVLSSIKGVFLSHNHMDHHAGFISLIKEVARAKSMHRRSFEDASKIYCVMPMNMVMFYDSYCKHYAKQVHDMVVFVPTEKVRHGHLVELDNISALCAIIGIKNLIPIPVTHGVITYGLSLLTHCGKKVVYSADTLPMNDRLIYDGMGADLLIHDCLYVDGEWELDSRLRKHSYLKGTLATVSAMQAKFTLLTHFAPFLPVVPVSDLPGPYSKSVACAYDFLDVSLSDLHELPKLEPAVLAVYKESLERYNDMMAARKERQLYRNEAVQRLMHIM